MKAKKILKNLTYGHALEMGKAGLKISRKGWNGKGMWVTVTPSRTLDMKVDDIWTENVMDMAIENGGTVVICSYMSMKTADGNLQIGWVPSQADNLANDWCVVE